MTDWRSVVIGFLVITIFGIVGLTLPGVGQLAAGLIGGFVAGYLAGGGLGRGFWHGLLAGALGGIVAGVLVALVVGVAGWAGGPIGGAMSGLAGFGIFLVALALSFIMALESAIAGAIGGLFNSGSSSEPGAPERRV
ncbi:DUF5518 domain-containing protein [Natronococcus roseus]|uniref:DUF5518 domain-containing protein n=1 Tax=Natronococcus roseus TaxID=1052014 RepID=UPI00374DD717